MITSPDSEASVASLPRSLLNLPVHLRHTGHIVQYVKLSRETHEVIQNAVVPGSFFVDVFPVRT
jgi:hypothetical protein